jgi:hypothetical protein
MSTFFANSWNNSRAPYVPASVSGLLHSHIDRVSCPRRAPRSATLVVEMYGGKVEGFCTFRPQKSHLGGTDSSE